MENGKYVCYGTGRRAEELLKKLGGLVESIVAFIDNDVAKQKNLFWGKPIISLAELEKYQFQYILILSKRYYSEMKKSLSGIVDEDIILSEEMTEELLDKRWIRAVYQDEVLPNKIVLEACTACQLNCVSCYMRRDNYGTMGKGYLRFENFKKLIDESPYIEIVELSNSGEIFLNPELKRIIEYAYKKGVRLRANGGCNFNTVTDDMLECLVDNKFDEIMIAIDGASQNTYARYRRNGNFDKVIENISKLVKIKKRKNSRFPKIVWQFIIMESSESDIIRAKSIAKELEIPIVFKMTWDSAYVPSDQEMIQKETGLKYITRKEYTDSTNKIALLPCMDLFEHPVINWDGRLLGCCRVYQNDFRVNVFEMGLEKALRSYNYKMGQKIVMGDVDIEKIHEIPDIPCVHCEIGLQYMKNKEDHA